METKKQFRQQVLKLRAEVTDEWVIKKSREITARICALPEFLGASRILAYCDCRHEVMTRFLIEEAWRTGRETAVPKVVGKDMVFCRLTDFGQLEPGCYGIPEPVGQETIDWEDALMIMPGVAFDRNKNRIGYGGGYYDRYLSAHPHLVTVAAAFDFQLFSTVPAEPTDIRPQILATESGLY